MTQHPRREQHPHTVETLARQVSPHLAVVSVSSPEPELREHNIVAVSSDEAEARRAVVALEAEEGSDATVGLVILGSHPDDALAPADGRVDPERVTGFVGRRTFAGGVVGAVVGMAVLAGVVALLTDGLAPVITAAVAGLFFFAVWGGLMRAFSGMGGGDAYRQSYVPPQAADVVLVSLHTDDVDTAQRAKRRLEESQLDLRVLHLDAAGRPRQSQ